MKAVDIWVEGVADQKFLSDVISEWFNLSFDKDFKCKDADQNIRIQIRQVEGISKFNSKSDWQKVKPFFEENQASGVKNLIILDADEDFEKRKDEVKGTVIEVEFASDKDLFLWPNHQPHTEKGDLENLLEQIINPEHQLIFKCWDAYENCLRSYPDKNYTTPARKTKIYAYLEALLGETQSEKENLKEKKRDYSNTDHWILDHTKEPLKHLYEFLKKHLKP